MFVDAHLPGAFESLRRLLLELARTHDAEALPARVVDRLAAAPDVTLATLWLGSPPAVAATAGLDDPAVARGLAALAEGPVARAIAQGEAIHARLGRTPDDGTPQWMIDARLRGVGFAPLLGRDAPLGALAVYTWRPFDPAALDSLRVVADHLAAALDTARAFAEIERLKQALEVENALLKDEVDDVTRWGGLIGQSEAMSRVIARIDVVAHTDATVLVHGESGVGKELVAREIHRRSDRADRPLVRVNCASIPAELFESEFFGHVRGAFTGAIRDRLGRFAAADGGTLFLDEVGEIPPGLQGKLLRVLQEGQYERVGEERTRSVDVRIIAATNRDLPAEVEAGRFRRDLYYRLEVFPIEVAPLRARLADIEPLARHFTERAAQRFNVPRATLDRPAIDALEAHPWPGNVRELRNVVERAVLACRGGVLRFEGLQRAAAELPPASSGRVLTDAEMSDLVRSNLERALVQAEGRIYGAEGAAALLGVPATTLASRLKALGLR